MNRCDSCRILAVTDCPILNAAYNKGLEGMQYCEMAEAVEKVYQAAKGNGIKPQDGRANREPVAA